MAYAPVVAKADEMTWDEEHDVVVCGGGTAGGPAAIEAFDAGSDVVIVEKQDWLGGCGRRCAGSVAAAGTIVQEKLGVEDNADDYYDYLVACAEGNADDDLLRVVADDSADLIRWIIEDLGGQPLDEWEFAEVDEGDEGFNIVFAPGLNVSGTPVHYETYDMDEIQRDHQFTPNYDDTDPGDRCYSSRFDGVGTGFWKTIEDAIVSRNIPTLFNTSLTKLVMGEDGTVLGVSVRGEDGERLIKARQGVILSTGTFVNDPELFKNFTGEDWVEPTDESAKSGGYTTYQADGAGVKAAFAAGAAPSFIYQGNKGGVKINTESQVVNMNGEVIPRLYAAGRTSGGVVGPNYPLCGVYVASAMEFGRIAGKGAAALDRWDA